MGYKCWVYVLKVVPIGTYYVGFTGNLKERLDAHRKGRGYKTTRFRPFEVVEVVECDSDTVRELEKEKTLEYIDKYGKEKVVGFRFSFKKRQKKESQEKRPSPPATYSLIRYGEEEDDFRICGECIHYDYSDHYCMLLDEVTLRPNTCVFWSSGLWGETPEVVVENATREAQSWFTPERADLVREYHERACPAYRIFEGAFPELGVKKPYTVFRTQKELVYDFLYDSVGIPEGENRWEEYEKLHEAVKERVGFKKCSESQP